MTGNEKILAYIEKHGGVKNVDAAAKACGLTVGSLRTLLAKLRATGQIAYRPRDLTSITVVLTSLPAAKKKLEEEANALLSGKPRAAKRSIAKTSARPAAERILTPADLAEVPEPEQASTPTSDRIVLSAANLRAIADGARGIAALVDMLLTSAPTFTSAIVQLANVAGPLQLPPSPAPAPDGGHIERATPARRAPRRAPRATTKAKPAAEDPPAPEEEPSAPEAEEEPTPKATFRCLAEDGANVGEYFDLDAALRAFTRSSSVHSVVRIVDGHVVRTRAPAPRRGAAA